MDLQHVTLKLDFQAEHTLTRTELVFTSGQQGHCEDSGGEMPSEPAQQRLQLLGPSTAIENMSSLFVSIGDTQLDRSQYDASVHAESGSCNLLIRSSCISQLGEGSSLTVQFLRTHPVEADGSQGGRHFAHGISGDQLRQIAFVPAYSAPVKLTVVMQADIDCFPLLVCSAAVSSEEQLPSRSVRFEQAALRPIDHLVLAAGSRTALRAEAAHRVAGLEDLLAEQEDGGESEEEIEFISPPVNNGDEFAEERREEEASEWDSWRAGIQDAAAQHSPRSAEEEEAEEAGGYVASAMAGAGGGALPGATGL